MDKQNNTYEKCIYEEDKIDLKELFATLFKYKYSILLIAALFTLAAGLYAYYKPNIYRVTATVEVSAKKSVIPNSDDILSAALNQGNQDIDTEIQILKSRFVTSLALKKVDFIKHYYGIKFFKRVELYKNSPISVDIKQGYGTEYKITPKGKDKFLLEVDDAKDGNGTKLSYKKEHKFGEHIKSKYFDIVVNKVGDFKYDKYIFEARDPRFIADKIRKKLQVSQAGKKQLLLISLMKTILPLEGSIM